MKQLLDLVVIALAVWRISNMLADVNQAGPLGILDILRYKAGVKYDEFSRAQPTTNFAKGLICTFCNSTWLGIGFTVIYLLAPQVAFWLALPFALSAAAIMLESRITKDYP